MSNQESQLRKRKNVPNRQISHTSLAKPMKRRPKLKDRVRVRQELKVLTIRSGSQENEMAQRSLSKENRLNMRKVEQKLISLPIKDKRSLTYRNNEAQVNQRIKFHFRIRLPPKRINNNLHNQRKCNQS